MYPQSTLRTVANYVGDLAFGAANGLTNWGISRYNRMPTLQEVKASAGRVAEDAKALGLRTADLASVAAGDLKNWSVQNYNSMPSLEQVKASAGQVVDDAKALGSRTTGYGQGLFNSAWNAWYGIAAPAVNDSKSFLSSCIFLLFFFEKKKTYLFVRLPRYRSSSCH